MRALRALVRKDLNVWLHDRRAVVISFALPAALSLFFGLAFGGAAKRNERPRIPILVVAEDKSPGAQRLVAALAADATLTAKSVSREEAGEAVRNGTVSVAAIIPDGFADQMAGALRGGAEPPELTFIYDPTSAFDLAIVKGVVSGIVMHTLVTATDPDRVARCAEPFRTAEHAATGAGERYDGAAHAVAGMAVQFILMGAIENAVGILTDRQRGLWRRLRAAPLSKAALLGSRIVSGAIIALLVLVFLFAFGRFTLGVKILGSPLGMAMVSVSFALLASSAGVLVSTLGKTPQATRSAGIFVVLIATMLGGAWFPSFLFPSWLQPITRLIPSRWAVDGLDAMTWRGLDVTAAVAPAAGMIVVAAVFALLAAWRFRWEE
jgi:ABC-2 type transport system permease protein